MTAVCSVCHSIIRVPAHQVAHWMTVPAFKIGNDTATGLVVRCLNAGRGCKGTMAWVDADPPTVVERKRGKSKARLPGKQRS